MIVGQVAASPSFDKILAHDNDRRKPAPPDTFGSAPSPKAATEPPGIACDVGDRSLLPGLTSCSAPRHLSAPVRFPVGIIVYLASIALVATATIGVFFGMGFLLLVEPTEAMIPGVASTHGSDFSPPLLVVFSRLFGNSSSRDNQAASASIEPEIPGYAAVADLPPAPLAQPTTPDQAPLLRGDTTPLPVVVDQSAGIARNTPSEREMPGSEPAEASAEAPAGAGSPEPAPIPPAEAAPPAPSPLVLSAAEIEELLTRGDTFLRMGDITSARLFYERAANAGNGQGAMRMGASFDPSFLGRAGLRGARGDPVKAQSWYRKALELGAAESQRQPSVVEKR